MCSPIRETRMLSRERYVTRDMCFQGTGTHITRDVGFPVLGDPGAVSRVGRKGGTKGERAPGYRLSSNYFQNFKRMPAPDWAQKMLCIIVPNRRTVSPEFFS